MANCGVALAGRETVADNVTAINIAAAVPQTRTKAFFACTFMMNPPNPLWDAVSFGSLMIPLRKKAHVDHTWRGATNVLLGLAKLVGEEI